MHERQIRISDAGSLRHYRTELPNTFVRGRRGKGLTPATKWLYVYLKSIAGDTHECWQSTTTMAHGSGLGKGTVSRARRTLEQHGLIQVLPGERINRDTLHIRIVDIWTENMQEFSQLPQGSTLELQGSTMELQGSTMELQQPVEKTAEENSGVPPGNSRVPLGNSRVPKTMTKKIPLKKIPEKKENQHMSLSAKATDGQEGNTRGRDGYSRGFEQFWQTWIASPRKAKKDYCYGLWRRYNLEARSEEVCGKVHLWKETEQWQAGYEPAPATWLHQRQFNDEVPTREATKRRGVHDGHRIAHYPAGPYCYTCKREVLPREFAYA